jgi:ribonuclease HII
MPWVVGIDEAGYGPNLGPLVMTAVACRVPRTLVKTDLWQALRSAVRRTHEKQDGRLLLEDSKLVYCGARGLGSLERGVLAFFGSWSAKVESKPPLNNGLTLARLAEALCPGATAQLEEERWYTGTTTLPVAAEAGALVEAAARLGMACSEARIAWGLVRSVVVCPTRFNAVLERWGSKAVVLGLALADLLAHCHCPNDGADPVYILIDKHGGRNNYAAMLQQAVPDGMVLADEEGPKRSNYRLIGLKRPVQVTFAPRMDSAHLCVALASMISKYLRELLMHEFNDFWLIHVPGLKPTAGYPGDARRFFQAIRPAATRLGISEGALWRRK